MADETAGYAVNELNSRGRKFPEKAHLYRSDFERDRDRIIHCSAFRRLEGKTQVFMPGLDDYYRTRLTHSIEVAQIGRTIARALRLNESLTEAVCLAHDLGHSPFGHSGEKVLNELMSEFGGFEHNRQTIRIVDLLEQPYPDFRGLNLMYETRLALAKHRGPYDKGADEFEGVNCSLEGQVADAADRIAYNCHDIEDAMRAGLLSPEQLKDVKLFTEAEKTINASNIADDSIRRTRTAKAIIDNLVSGFIEAGREALAAAAVKTVDDVYVRSEKLLVLPTRKHNELTEFETFLFNNVYTHRSVLAMTEKVKGWISRIFELYTVKPETMPRHFQELIEIEGLQRTVCDYIAGMTDGFCLKILSTHN